MNEEKLKTLRQTIDTIDSEIIKLIAKRMQIAEEIGAYKKEHKLPVLDSARWNLVIQKRIDEAKKRHLSEQLIKKVWDEFHKGAIEVEENAR